MRSTLLTLATTLLIQEQNYHAPRAASNSAVIRASVIDIGLPPETRKAGQRVNEARQTRPVIEVAPNGDLRPGTV